MPRLTVALEAFNEFRPSASYFCVRFVDGDQKLSLKLRPELDRGAVIVSKYSHQGSIRKSDAFQDNFAVLDGPERNNHWQMVPEACGHARQLQAAGRKPFTAWNSFKAGQAGAVPLTAQASAA